MFCILIWFWKFLFEIEISGNEWKIVIGNEVLCRFSVSLVLVNFFLCSIFCIWVFSIYYDVIFVIVNVVKYFCELFLWVGLFVIV